MYWCQLGIALQWRHNGRDGVSNHKPQDCLLKCLFRRRSNKTPKLCVTGLCEGNSPLTAEFSAQRDSKAIFFHLMTSSWESMTTKITDTMRYDFLRMKLYLCGFAAVDQGLGLLKSVHAVLLIILFCYHRKITGYLVNIAFIIGMCPRSWAGATPDVSVIYIDISYTFTVQVSVTLMWHERHGVSNHPHLDHMFSLTTLNEQYSSILLAIVPVAVGSILCVLACFHINWIDYTLETHFSVEMLRFIEVNVSKYFNNVVLPTIRISILPWCTIYVHKDSRQAIECALNILMHVCKC